LRQRPEQVLLVGGCVRDLLLGRQTQDLDLVVPHHAMALAKLVADSFGGAFVPIDVSRDVGRAVLSGRQPVVVDIASWRAGSLAEDLALRDVTINALAAELDAAQPQLIDVTGGLADLDRRVLAATSPYAFVDDPLRMLRVVRLQAELASWGFRLDAGTAEQARRHASLLTSSSAERVRDELVRILASEYPDQSLRQLVELDLCQVVLPEVDALRGVGQSYPHLWDVFEHTCRVVAHVAWLQRWLLEADEVADAADEALAETLLPYRERLATHLFAGRAMELRSAGHLLRWAALCHDWGKPSTRSVLRDQQGHETLVQFIGHERAGATLTQDGLRRLRFSEDAVRRVSAMVEHHMRPLHLAAGPHPSSARAVYRYFRELGNVGVDVALLSLSDVKATAAGIAEPENWQRLLQVVARLLGDYFDRPNDAVTPPSLIDGNDLMAGLGLAPGRLVGHLLEAVAEAQAAGEVHSTQEALALAAALAAKSMEGGATASGQGAV
jgi:tRNA nucleotidyltransferase/poly(A) polymerase